MTITQDTSQLVTGMPWQQYLAHMDRTWEPGQHIAMIGPTGEGIIFMVIAHLKKVTPSNLRSC